MLMRCWLGMKTFAASELEVDLVLGCLQSFNMEIEVSIHATRLDERYIFRRLRKSSGGSKVSYLYVLSQFARVTWLLVRGIGASSSLQKGLVRSCFIGLLHQSLVVLQWSGFSLFADGAREFGGGYENTALWSRAKMEEKIVKEEREREAANSGGRNCGLAAKREGKGLSGWFSQWGFAMVALILELAMGLDSFLVWLANGAVVVEQRGKSRPVGLGGDWSESSPEKDNKP
ncbi:hypothetical protein H5410_005702 [Solanum commersonii]|uniref:Uncharacterized protein n=1 Tax=Solanum commersonii TaxID=4109 RepID=A0A9J6A892_SOLCO|nr:hypothetical protein H5410_005702 [Solanum commersonii]